MCCTVRKIYTVCAHYREANQACARRKGRRRSWNVWSKFSSCKKSISTEIKFGFCRECRSFYQGYITKDVGAILNYWAYKNRHGYSDPVPAHLVPADVVFGYPAVNEESKLIRYELMAILYQLPWRIKNMNDWMRKLEEIRNLTLNWAAEPPPPPPFSTTPCHPGGSPSRYERQPISTPPLRRSKDGIDYTILSACRPRKPAPKRERNTFKSETMKARNGPILDKPQRELPDAHMETLRRLCGRVNNKDFNSWQSRDSMLKWSPRNSTCSLSSSHTRNTSTRHNKRSSSTANIIIKVQGATSKRRSRQRRRSSGCVSNDTTASATGTSAVEVGVVEGDSKNTFNDNVDAEWPLGGESSDPKPSEVPSLARHDSSLYQQSRFGASSASEHRVGSLALEPANPHNNNNNNNKLEAIEEEEIIDDLIDLYGGNEDPVPLRSPSPAPSEDAKPFDFDAYTDSLYSTDEKAEPERESDKPCMFARLQQVLSPTSSTLKGVHAALRLSVVSEDETAAEADKHAALPITITDMGKWV
ncbi:hypothetical protein B0H63DRAFT_42151 [Podospora didyma]|uniref:Uncharacterized protein n=1 Tax=Podospora didyma TaxID=330526 RepID=A0AAE0P6M0_9PEZI|nr:hypothetical protein B0H63DRAFT_42151 [Podospora didyma]